MARRAIQLEDLLSRDTLESLESLRFVARRVPKGGRFAEQRSRDLGSGIEFRDYRPYAPGDDLRSIDWNIYRRLGRVFLRLFEEMENLPLYLLPDVSASMFFEDPPRCLAGLRCALALAAVGLAQHDTVGLLPFADDLRLQVRPAPGQHRLLGLARAMTTIEAGGTTDLGKSLSRFRSLGLRSGLVVIISDFFDPAGTDGIAAALKHVRHKLLVQLVRRTDRDPALRGEVRLEDCETGRAEEISITAAIRSRYRKSHDRFQQDLVGLAQRCGAGFVRVDVDAEIVPQLATLFESGRYPV